LTDAFCSFGEDGFIMHRADLLSALYDSFSATEKAKILTGKKVSDISSDENGVKVQCADGTSYEGSIAIGADGVHSAARRAIRSLALKAGKPDVDGENPFTTQFRMLWLSAPRPARVRPARSAQSFNKTASVQMLLGKEKCWIFLYERLDTPAAKSDRVTYTEQDMFDYIEKWGHLTCEDDLTVRDVFATRYKAGLINLEEGVVNQWHQGRICLVGDAAHKFTPNAGLGFNNGAQDVAVALNEILRVVKADPNPTVPALSAAFDKYQSIRMEPLVKDYKASAVTTRYQTYETFLYWFIDRCLMRYLGFMQRGLLNLGVVDRVRIARPLEFLPGSEPFQGKTPWDFPMSQTIDLKR
jgi:2-polyprenyl-6-methoxyphenol hydroxylase-like FAD-dependent oxidoreductase